jgi:DnaJ like chaperone protein
MFSLIGIFVGYILGDGFLGGFLGFIIGSFIDGRRRRKKIYQQQRHYNKDNFTEILLSLAAHVIKADGVVKESELKYVTKNLFQNYSPEYAQQLYQKLRNYIENDIHITVVCQDLYKNATVHEKLYIIQFLLGLASSDGVFHQNELNVIQQISDRIGVNRGDFESIKAMFFMFKQGGAYYGARGYQYGAGSQSYSSTYSSEGYNSTYGRTSYNLENEYNILEIPSTATDDEVKKAYRRLAQKYHPDKVNHLGDDIRKDAETKFVRLNQAYERIKESRSMK